MLGNMTGGAHWLWENYMEGKIPDAETSGDFVDPDLFQFPETYSTILHAAFHDSLEWHFTRHKASNANTVIDLVLERMRDMCMNLCPRLSTAFAVRLFLDAHESLGEEYRNRPLADLDAAAIRCRMKARLQVAGLKKAGIDDGPLPENVFPPGLLSSSPRLLVRISTQILEGICEQSESARFLTQKNFRTRLSQNPIACGLHQLYLEVLQSASAVALADQWKVLIPLAHFYNAAKLSGKLSLPWPDMEFLIDIHGPDWLFLGGRPNDITGCLSKYLALNFGTHGSVANKLRNSSSNPQYYQRRKLWPRFCPLSRYLFSRFSLMGKLKEQRVTLAYDSEGHVLDLEDLQLIVLDLNQHKENHSIELNDGALTKKHQLRKRVGHSNLSAVDLLSSIDRHLATEVKGMRFDHGALQRRAVQAMEQMSDTKRRAGFSPSLDMQGQGPTLEPWVIMDPMLAYYRLKSEERDRDYRIDLETARLPWAEDIMSRWNVAVQGLDEWLHDMKKKGVKDLCSDLV